MIQDPGDTFFPYNVVATIEGSLMTLDSDLTFIRRKILVTDPDQSIAVVPATWEELEPGREIGRSESTIQSYDIMIQSLIVDADEERGLRTHSYLAMRIRQLLARDPVLRVGLSQLTTTDPRGVRETATQWKTGQQIFHTANLDNEFRYLSTLEFRLETQIL